MNNKLFTHAKTFLRRPDAFRLFRRNLDRDPAAHSRVKRRYYAFSACAVIVMVLSGLILASYKHFSQQSSGPFGPEARLPVSRIVVSEASFPPGRDTVFPLALSRGPSQADCFALASFGQGASVTAEASRTYLSCSLPLPFFANAGKKRGLVNFDRGRVSIATESGPVTLTELRRSPLVYMPDADPFEADLFSPAPPHRDAPQLFGERTDENGLPLRWLPAADPDLLVCSPPRYNDAEVLRRLIHGLGVLSAEANYFAQASKYRDFVRRYAEKYNLASSLVLAIMHTESNFNPFAVSARSAVGLMQIVPDTAGNEVYRFLMGTPGSPSIETLFTPEHNIRYGAVYLHLLGQRYFGRVSNPSSRQMCMIAAYNGGPGAVMRLFAADQDEALARINALTPSEVYTALTTEMPSPETRRYVEVVLARIRDYSVQ